MSEFAYSSARRLLVNNTNVTNKVPAACIKTGFVTDEILYPSITITQVAGGTWGYLGWGTSTNGSRLRRDETVFQIDIYNRHSMVSSQRIADAIDYAFISSGRCRKISDNDVWDENLNTYRKIQTWTYWENVND